ncbi:MAG: FixH family protein [Candidatus Lambdaproteobacteria bacterium]|nr:FixH family protein [Candidatus Lambdaproteobacteria bacterium]
MSASQIRFHGRRTALGLLLIAAVHVTALAAPGDYRLEAVGGPVKSGANAVVAVRLVHAPSGKPVANAVVFRSRLDMSPAGMADMTARLTPVASSEPGVYRFQGELADEGEWALSVSAKVPGEPATVNAQARIKVVR